MGLSLKNTGILLEVLIHQGCLHSYSLRVTMQHKLMSLQPSSLSDGAFSVKLKMKRYGEKHRHSFIPPAAPPTLLKCCCLSCLFPLKSQQSDSSFNLTAPTRSRRLASNCHSAAHWLSLWVAFGGDGGLIALAHLGHDFSQPQMGTC